MTKLNNKRYNKGIAAPIALIIIAVIAIGLTFYIIGSQVPEDSGEQPEELPEELTEEGQACIDSGGIITTALCCESAGDFPGDCAIGACGCAPEYSHEVKVCNCGEGKCFDGKKCISFEELQKNLEEQFSEENLGEEDSSGQSEQNQSEICKISIGGIAKTELLQLASWGDGALSMNVPLGWNTYSGGECATKSMLSRDPSSELKQVFYFSEAGPVYTSQAQKENDQLYMAMGGFPIFWHESPVVSPLTAENYLRNFGAFASTSLFQQAFPQAPIMHEVEIISTEEIADKPYYATDAKLIRAEFKQNNKSGEGYFYIITTDFPSMGFGYGMMFIGITAPKGLLDLISPSLTKSLESFTLSQGYVNACIQAQNKAAAGALEAGKILSQSSDTIMDVWENKLESEERMSEKQSDALFGYSRLYNPETDEVYEITPEFYDYYQNHSNEFELNYLEELPDDKWSYAPLNGAQHIR